MMNKPKRDNLDYRYGIFAKIAHSYGGPSSKYWTNKQIKEWCDMNIALILASLKHQEDNYLKKGVVGCNKISHVD